MFYAESTSKVIFTVKTSLDLFSLGLGQVSVLSDCTYVMKRVTESGRQGIRAGTSFLRYIDPGVCGGDLLPTMPGCVCPKVKDMVLFLASSE